MTNNNIYVEASSFKDPDASVFVCDGVVIRKLYKIYHQTYQKLMQSGLYEKLTQLNLLVKHEEISKEEDSITIKPEQVFISYPWEWCFSQLKDVALATLEIQIIALDYGMSLKDANCFNIQFSNNKPLLIDTSSFEEYKEGCPWVAYRQFCENFIAPLALMAYTDINLSSLFLGNINGIPLNLTAKLLPFKTKFNFNLFTHIHLHSKMQTQYADNSKKIVNANISKQQLKNILSNLKDTIEGIKLPKVQTEWGDYYNFTNYSDSSFNEKKNIIENFKQEIQPKQIWDFGCNEGVFSRLFADEGNKVIAFDIDKIAIEKNYLKAKQDKETNIFPLVFDISNPSPALGFSNQERKTIQDRAKNVDMILALALIHHLRFTCNLPFYKVAEYFSSIAKYLIIEFVDKKDSQVEKMLLNRKDVFADYTQEIFEQEFSKYYNVLQKKHISGTERTLYLFEKLNSI